MSIGDPSSPASVEGNKAPRVNANFKPHESTGTAESMHIHGMNGCPASNSTSSEVKLLSFSEAAGTGASTNQNQKDVSETLNSFPQTTYKGKDQNNIPAVKRRHESENVEGFLHKTSLAKPLALKHSVQRLVDHLPRNAPGDKVADKVGINSIDEVCQVPVERERMNQNTACCRHGIVQKHGT